ncbi:MAG TPA: YjjG family noncanonical pyrimidine nucleotidase [Flavobacterium sp.]|jgi:putative hydrolase of the HAD superfamily
MKLDHITDIFFDLDHTLWDFEKNSALAFKEIWQSRQMNIDLDSFLSHYVPLNYQYWERYRNGEITQEVLRYGRLRDTFELLNYVIGDEMIEQLSSDYIEILPDHNHLFEGAIEVLQYLSARYNLHIITNGFDEVQNRKIVNSGLAQYFQTITNSEMAGVKKPDPRIFEYALAKANARKESSIMIGDCIEADVRGALNCGIDAILFNGNVCEDGSIKHIKHLQDLKIYL